MAPGIVYLPTMALTMVRRVTAKLPFNHFLFRCVRVCGLQPLSTTHARQPLTPGLTFTAPPAEPQAHKG